MPPSWGRSGARSSFRSSPPGLTARAGTIRDEGDDGQGDDRDGAATGPRRRCRRRARGLVVGAGATPSYLEKDGREAEATMARVGAATATAGTKTFGEFHYDKMRVGFNIIFCPVRRCSACRTGSATQFT